MAREKGIIKLKGTIGDITFYKSKEGLLPEKKEVLMQAESRQILLFKEAVKTVLN